MFLATYEENTLIKVYDKRGDCHIQYPKTKVEQVIGLEDKISEIQESTKVTDTYGIAGTAGASVKPQNMFNAIGNFMKNSAITTGNFLTNFKARLNNSLDTIDEGYALDARMGKTLDGEIAVKISVFDDTINGLKVGSTLNLPSISFNMINSLSICNVISTNSMFVMTGSVISETFRFSGVYMDADGANPVPVGLDILFDPNTKKVTKIVKSSNWPSNVTTVGQLELFILRKTLS